MPKWVQWSLTHQPALFGTAFDRLFSKVQLIASAGCLSHCCHPHHSLPALAEALCAKGLLPKRVQWSLTHQPALFDTAFDRLLSKAQSLTQTQAAFLIAACPGEGLCAKSLIPNGPSHTDLHCLTPLMTWLLARYRSCLQCKLLGDLLVLSDSCLNGCSDPWHQDSLVKVLAEESTKSCSKQHRPVPPAFFLPLHWHRVCVPWSVAEQCHGCSLSCLQYFAAASHLPAKYSSWAAFSLPHCFGNLQ